MSVGIIELLNDIETIINTNLRVIHNAKSRWDYFADVSSAVPLEFEAIRKAILEAKARDTRSRFNTEIKKESISYAKEFMKIVELRHLDGVNFGVSDSEYIAISTTGTNQDEPKSVPHAVYSDKRGDVQQHQFIFEILWTKAIPAEQRNRKIEESAQPVSTRVLEDQVQNINEIRRLNYSSKRLSVCSALGGMQMGYKYLLPQLSSGNSCMTS